MNMLSRTSRNPIAKWWWTVDRQMVIGVMVLLGMGFFAAFAASPAVAQHIGKSTYYFANKQLVFLGLPLLFSSPCPCSTRYGFAAWPC